MGSLVETQTYLDKRKFGGNKDGGLDSDEEEQYNNDPDVMDKTPVTKKKMIEAKEAAKIQKLSPGATYLTLMKGFVCVGVLYVPKAFINGGWLFTMGALAASAVCTCYCSHLLLDAKIAAKAESYTALGKACYGNTGEMLVNLAVGSS
jgi:solute carrier family 36 (proton-coupled amino acid transporter)